MLPMQDYINNGERIGLPLVGFERCGTIQIKPVHRAAERGVKQHNKV